MKYIKYKDIWCEVTLKKNLRLLKQEEHDQPIDYIKKAFNYGFVDYAQMQCPYPVPMYQLTDDIHDMLYELNLIEDYTEFEMIDNETFIYRYSEACYVTIHKTEDNKWYYTYID